MTITNNRGQEQKGGGLVSDLRPGPFGPEPTTVVKNSIIANNKDGDTPSDCVGPLTLDSVYNLIGDPTGCELPPRPEGFKLNIGDPKLGKLALNGGTTRNHLPAPDSPSIDAGFPFSPGGPAADACEPLDQRGVPRLLCDMGAVEREVQVPTEFSVTTTADEVDVRPGDGTCQAKSNTCSLRAAIQEANRLPGTQAINVPPGHYGLLISPGDEGGVDPAAGGDLDLLDAAGVIVVGPNKSFAMVTGIFTRIFDVAPGAMATIRRMNITQGNDSAGGGVRVSSGSLTLDTVLVEDNRGGGIHVRGLHSVLDISDSVISNNRRPGGDGGGISSTDANAQIMIKRTRISNNEASSGGGLQAVGEVSVIQSTIARNRAAGNGGGISVAAGLNLQESTVSGNTAEGPGGGVFALFGSIVNSTVSGNTSGTQGGGVSTSGTLSLLHVTIADNKAMAGGNGLDRFGSGSELFLRNTILANPGGEECAGLPPASGGNNIASDTSCGLTAGGDQQATLAGIGPLADNGGPTETHLPTDISPAIDAAADVGLLTDQRGVPRPQGPGPDIGSVERMN